jgi:phosphopantothenoylcysteine decarboxylase/phosphopantothenate--cysteine ligase
MKFLVTAGPTREPLDPVRYLSNRSSGKMGYAIARATASAGHETTLISGPVSLAAPENVRMVRVSSSDEMYEAVHANIDAADVFVMCAAVADFKAAQVSPHKIKKAGREGFQLELVPTRDILLSLRERGVRARVVGFAAETQSLEKNARRKLREKGCALVIGNDVSREGIGFESDENELTLFFASGEVRLLPRASKNHLAVQLIEIFAELYKM